MKTNNTLIIFVTPVTGEEIQIEKACTLKQAVTLAKKEARKLINAGGMFVMINIQARVSYGVETLAHIEAEKEGRRVKFSDETPAETYAVCWGDEYKEEDGENNAIAETADESEAKEIAESESEANGCIMSVVRKSDGKTIAIYNNQPEPTTPSTMNANEITATEFSELSHAETIARRIEAMKPRGAWNNGVKQYALMLLDWYETEANESPLTLETMLNGAKDWKQYACGGAGVAQCYNARIAETLCSPSELKRNNHGAKMPNRFENWLDIEARALFQAWQLINEAGALVNCNA